MSDKERCVNCGYCPQCGRSDNYPWGHYYPYSYPYRYVPMWPTPVGSTWTANPTNVTQAFPTYTYTVKF